ncbi:MAG: hypothetical protein HY790_09110 [Deltaproteobacteria bacterium]|nr:hypothetical protein [Deltaproteobacteria bacterium]
MNAWQRLRSTRLMCKPVLVLLLASSLLMGCASPQQNPTMYQGAGLGAALGAGLGAAINHRNPWKGAAIGALLGGAGGGIAGDIYGRSNPPQGYYNQGYAPRPGYGYQQPPPNYSYNQGDPNYYSSQPPPQLQY